MKSFKSIREGNYVEPGVSEVNDVPEDPLSFVEIKPKKTKVVKEDLQEAVSVKKQKHSWGTMMTIHHGSDTSYPLHPEHQSAIKKLRPGMKTTFKDETNSTVHAHREGDTVHLTRPKTGSTLTSLPYHHFDTSEHAKPSAKKPAGEYDRKVTDHLKKKYNEETEQMDELKKSTLGSYIKKSSADAVFKTNAAADEREAIGRSTSDSRALEKKATQRVKGVGRAIDRLTKEEAELEEGIKSKIAGVALSALAAHGAAHGRVTPDGQGGFTGGFKASPTVTAPASASAPAAPVGFSREYLQGVVDGKHPRPLLSKEKAAEHLKNMKEETEQILEAPKSIVKLVQKLQTTKRHMVAKSRAKKLVTASKSASAAGDKMTADAAMSKSKRYSNIAKGMEEQMDEKVTSKDIKMAVGVAKDKRYAGGNMSGAVKTMEKMKPGLSKHPRVQQVLKSTQEGYSDDDMESTRQFRSAITGLKAKSAIDKAKDGASAKYYHDGAKVTPQETARRSAERKAQKDKKGVTEGIDFLKIWNGIKPVHEEIKTTHEDPLVVTKDEDGNIHTHANLSVANAIHGTNVKHQAIHTYKKVQDGKFTFELSKHHEGALKEDAPFDPVAHKKEHDRLITKHMEAHKAMVATPDSEGKDKANTALNAVKREIRNHKDKVPKGPAPKKDGGPGDYYASKKPGEYTGD